MLRRQLWDKSSGFCISICLLLMGQARGALIRDPPEVTSFSHSDTQFLDQIQRSAFDFFWTQADPQTGQVLDHGLANGNQEENNVVSSTASTGFGLVALCIGYERNYGDRAQILERINNTIKFIHEGHLEGHKGFYYHFVNMSSGARMWDCELSSIDTALLVSGVLFAKQYFPNEDYIVQAATEIYDRVDYHWFLNGGDTISMGWFPEDGGVFLEDSWNRYCELMILLLQGIGSRTHPIPVGAWDAIRRTPITFDEYTYIDGNGPLFTHQFSHSFIDFRGKRDHYANYWDNSIIATKAHKKWCIEVLGKNYSIYTENYWGLTSSEGPHGYAVWGGPPLRGSPQGDIVPCAAAGSLPFTPTESLDVLKNLKVNYSRSWGPFGFVDAFNPLNSWYSPNVLGIDVGITMLMIENARTGFVWRYYMEDPQLKEAMGRVGFVEDNLISDVDEVTEGVNEIGEGVRRINKISTRPFWSTQV